MGDPPRLRLRSGRGGLVRSVRRGHPWLWADSLEPAASLAAGTVVDVVREDDGFVGRGLYDPGSPIAVRIVTLDPAEAVDAALVRERVRAAAERRRGFIDPEQTDAYRLLHGEAERLPGVVVDRYADAAVVQYDGEAAATLGPALRAALLELEGVETVLERRTRDRVPEGAAPERRVVRENGLRFEVDLRLGQKTGLFLDQRESRALVRSLAGGARFLNLFAYTGGFTVAAAAGGAARSLSVEISKPVVEAARRNLALNGADPERHRLLAGDVFELLAPGGSAEAPSAARPPGVGDQRDRRERGPRAPDLGGPYDLAVVDPPSMARRRADLAKALPAYRRLNASALGLVAPGGKLLTCSCSSHLDRRSFLALLDEAAREARVETRVLEVRGAGPDHPVLRAFPEGDYLKVVLLEVRGRPRRAPRPGAKRARGARQR